MMGTPLIINGAQISLVQVARRVQIYIIYRFILNPFFHTKISGPESKAFVVPLRFNLTLRHCYLTADNNVMFIFYVLFTAESNVML